MGLFSSVFGGGSAKVKIDTSKIDPFDAAGAARQEAKLNRLTQISPFGRLSFEGQNRNLARFSLPPHMRRLLNQQSTFSTSSANTARKMLRGVPLSGKAATDAMMSRLQPQFDLEDRALRERLEQSGNPAAYGSVDMSEGGFNELALMNQRQNDARMAAVLAGPQYQAQLAQTAMQMGNAAPLGLPQFNFQNATPINYGGMSLGGYQARLNAASGAGNTNAQLAQQGRSDVLGGLFDIGSSFIGLNPFGF